MYLINNQLQVLIGDIETAPSKYWVWRPGEQVIRHDQMVEGSEPGIICISYKWAHQTKIYNIDWGYEEQNTAKVIEEFDKIVKQAHVFIGKNSDKFDIRHINTQRLIANLPAFPDWSLNKDDVEKQLRRYFLFPSYSLDYVSKLFGFGGKEKMVFKDWVDIVEKNKDGKAALKKMKFYCNKDVSDTDAMWKKILPHIKPRFHAGALLDSPNSCPQCASINYRKDGHRFTSLGKKPKYLCTDCGRSFVQATKTRTGF